jgi:cold shock CspA family protein
MPTGRVSWFDAKHGVGRVVASGREYPVAAADMETGARGAGARVRFDVARQGGVDRAVDVRRIPGTRTVPRQRRFQDLTGAGRPEEKGRRSLTHRHPERAVTPSKPKAVALRWVAAANSGSVVATRELYAADAVLHARGDTRRGRAAVPGWLLDHNLLAPAWQADPGGEGDGGTFVITRPGGPVPGRSRIRVTYGQISEQWLDEP